MRIRIPSNPLIFGIRQPESYHSDEPLSRLRTSVWRRSVTRSGSASRKRETPLSLATHVAGLPAAHGGAARRSLPKYLWRPGRSRRGTTRRIAQLPNMAGEINLMDCASAVQEL